MLKINYKSETKRLCNRNENKSENRVNRKPKNGKLKVNMLNVAHDDDDDDDGVRILVACCRSIGCRFIDDSTAISAAPTISVENCQPLE